MIKAAVFEDIQRIVYKEDYPKPIIGKDDVIVKVHYCGICGSDITNFKLKLYQVPLIMGHEFTGEVVEVGENVSGVKPGEKVCGINVALDLSQRKLSGMGIFEDGGFAEYVKVPLEYLFRIPKNISTKEAVMIESFANAVRGTRLSNIEDNQNILIIGGGNIGLCFLKYLLNEKNPNYIGVIEPHIYLREKCMQFGATDAFSPSMTKIKRFIKSYGEPSFIFDCAGNEKSMLMAINLIKKGGTILLEGLYKGTIVFPMSIINSKEICIKGCISHDREDILNSIDFFDNNEVNADDYISKIISLKDMQDTFKMILSPGERKFIKIIVKID
ncbi:MAG: zinc-dependent alcohol dehydrogenase [Promethearchaeota archaeon]